MEIYFTTIENIAPNVIFVNRTLADLIQSLHESWSFIEEGAKYDVVVFLRQAISLEIPEASDIRLRTKYCPTSPNLRSVLASHSSHETWMVLLVGSGSLIITT